jgi:hypothetical protein
MWGEAETDPTSRQRRARIGRAAARGDHKMQTAAASMNPLATTMGTL